MVCAYASPSISSNHPNFRESQDTNSLKTCKAVCFSDFCTKIPFGNLCQRGRLTTQKIEPFFNANRSCRSWRDQRRWQIKGGKGIGVDSIYTQGPTEKNIVCPEQNQKTHIQKRLFWFLFMGKWWENGTTSLFLGGEDGGWDLPIWEMERSCDHLWSVSQAVEAAMKLAVKESAALKRLVPSLLEDRGVIGCQGRWSEVELTT